VRLASPFTKVSAPAGLDRRAPGALTPSRRAARWDLPLSLPARRTRKLHTPEDRIISLRFSRLLLPWPRNGCRCASGTSRTEGHSCRNESGCRSQQRLDSVQQGHELVGLGAATSVTSRYSSPPCAQLDTRYPREKRSAAAVAVRSGSMNTLIRCWAGHKPRRPPAAHPPCRGVRRTREASAAKSRTGTPKSIFPWNQASRWCGRNRPRRSGAQPAASASGRRRSPRRDRRCAGGTRWPPRPARGRGHQRDLRSKRRAGRGRRRGSLAPLQQAVPRGRAADRSAGAASRGLPSAQEARSSPDRT